MHLDTASWHWDRVVDADNAALAFGARYRNSFDKWAEPINFDQLAGITLDNPLLQYMSEQHSNDVDKFAFLDEPTLTGMARLLCQTPKSHLERESVLRDLDSIGLAQAAPSSRIFVALDEQATIRADRVKYDSVDPGDWGLGFGPAQFQQAASTDLMW